jgi:predicted nucleic acid-binding protein
MKTLFDTSVLVAALSTRHPAHQRAFEQLQKVTAGKLKGCLSTHALAELYSVMTGHPSWRISPSDLQRVLEEMLATFEVIPLSPREYQNAIARLVELSVTGGGVFDMLHARAALKAKAEVILTLNKKHFIRLGEDVAKLVKEP